MGLCADTPGVSAVKPMIVAAGGVPAAGGGRWLSFRVLAVDAAGERKFYPRPREGGAGTRLPLWRGPPPAAPAPTAIPCRVLPPHLWAGEPFGWPRGRPAGLLAPSAGLPGLFPPVALGGSLHVDGGVTCPVPTQRALDLGATRVWVLDVSRQ